MDESRRTPFDAIVIGSGIGGLACACALNRSGYRVLGASSAAGKIHALASGRPTISSHLHARTPVHGLYLTGQDVGSPGIIGAMMGGVLSAAAIEPKLLSQLA